MKTFKRPMFRKGGNVGVGIMSGITDRVKAQDGIFSGDETARPTYSEQLLPIQFQERENILAEKLSDMAPNIVKKAQGIELEGYESPEAFKSKVKIEEPKSAAEYIQELREGAGPYGDVDPATAYLLTMGPSIVNATSFRDAISKLGPANKALLDRLGKEAEFERRLRLKGTELGLADADKKADQRFNLALTADERDYKNYLTNDERKYLRAATLDNRLYQDLKDADKRKFEINLLRQTRAYEILDRDEKRAYDAKLLKEAKEYERMNEEEKRAYEKKLIDADQVFQLEKITKTYQAKTDAEGGVNFNLVKERFYNDTQDLNISENMANIVTKEIGETGRTQFSQAKDFLGNELANYTLAITTDLSIPSNLKAWEKANRQNIKEGVKYFIDGTTGGIKEIRKPTNDAEKETAKATNGLIIKDYSFSDLADIKDVDTDTIEVEEKVTGTGLTRSEAEKIASEKGLTLIPKRPEDDKTKIPLYIRQQKEKLGPNAVTMKELEDILKIENRAKKGTTKLR